MEQISTEESAEALGEQLPVDGGGVAEGEDADSKMNSENEYADAEALGQEVREEGLAETNEEVPADVGAEATISPEVIQEREEHDQERLDEVRSDLDESAKAGAFAGGMLAGALAGVGGRRAETTSAEVKYRLCERCRGSGRRWLIFRCPACGGNGRVVASHKVQRSA